MTSTNWGQLTLTEARRNLDRDDQQTIRELAEAMIRLIDKNPEEAANVLFSSWMKARCDEVDAGERKGAGTKEMLQFYRDRAESVANRIFGPVVQVEKR